MATLAFFFWIPLLVVIAGIALCSVGIPGSAGLLLLGAAAAFLVGCFAGFLFSVPRTSAGEPPENQDGKSADARPGVRHRVNDSLEQIADWLTKIIVGLGLVHLPEIRDAIGNAIGFWDAQYEGLGAVMVTLQAACSVLGFLAGYVVTRIQLQGLISTSDRRLDEKEKEITRKEEEVSRKEEEAARDHDHARKLLRSVEALAGTSSQMVNLLYESGGFPKAIELAQKFLQDDEHEEPEDSVFWLRLACAYGQKFEDEPDDFSDADGKELWTALRKAVEVHPAGSRQLIRELSDPSFPRKDPGENDLQAYYESLPEDRQTQFRNEFWTQGDSEAPTLPGADLP